jgi:hypothetical protein
MTWAVTPLPSRRLRLHPPDDVAASTWPLRPRVLIGTRVSGLAPLRSSGGIGELSMIQKGGGLCRLRLGPTPTPAASRGDRASPSRSQAQLTNAEKRCRTATPWPIGLCSARSSASPTRPFWWRQRTCASRFSLLLQEQSQPRPLAVDGEPDPECSFSRLAHPLDASGPRVRSSP